MAAQQKLSQPPASKDKTFDQWVFWLWQRVVAAGQYVVSSLSFTQTKVVAGRNSAGAGVGEEVTATQLLDWVGSTSGDILQRGASTWGVVAPGDLTKADDTNVTLTLGGTPTGSLVKAVSITAGWTGTLAAARLNSNVVQGVTNDTNVTGSISAQNLTLGWTGSLGATRGGTAQTTYTLGDILYSSASNTLSKLAGNTTSTKKFLRQTGTGTVSAAPAWDTVTASDITGADLTKVNDTNVTLTLGGTPTGALLKATSITAGWTGILASSRGGTGNGFTKFTGPTTAEKTFTLPDASATLLYSGGALGTPSSGTLTNCSGLPESGVTNLTTDLAGKASTGAIGSSGLTMSTARLLGRTTASTGAVEEITVGSGLTLSAGALTATGTGGTVTSVGLSLPAELTVSGSPVTTSGTLTAAWASETAKTFFAAPNAADGTPSFRAIVASDVPTLNQNTTGSAAKWTTARTLAGNSVDGSANVAFANKFIVQGTTDSGLSAAQFLGSLATGIVKNTTTTGVLSIAVAGDFPTLNQDTTGNAATATTATSATSATNATNTAITDDTTTNATMYPTWVTTTTGNLPQKVSSTKLTFNPSTATLTTTTFSGALSGNASTATKWATGRTVSVTGDLSYTSGSLDGSANVTGTGTLASVITAAGPIGSATVTPVITYDAKGRLTTVTSATVTPAVGSITGLGTGVATFLATPSSANLKAALTDETGSGAAVFATSPTLVTPVLGTPSSGTLTSCTGLPIVAGTTGTLTETRGGTNQTTYTLGDVLYSSASNTLAKLAGNTTSTKKFLRQTGTGTVSAAPAWDTIAASDVPTLNQNTTGSAATLTTGRTISVTGDLAYTSGSFNGSANVTGTGTLATVNANVGSFTNASITVNAKGLVTAASSGTVSTDISQTVSSNDTISSGYSRVVAGPYTISATLTCAGTLMVL